MRERIRTRSSADMSKHSMPFTPAACCRAERYTPRALRAGEHQAASEHAPGHPELSAQRRVRPARPPAAARLQPHAPRLPRRHRPHGPDRAAPRRRRGLELQQREALRIRAGPAAALAARGALGRRGLVRALGAAQLWRRRPRLRRRPAR